MVPSATVSGTTYVGGKGIEVGCCASTVLEIVTLMVAH